MLNPPQKPSWLACYLADVQLHAWRDHAARSDEPLECMSTWRGDHICVEVVNYETGETVEHLHLS